MRELIWSQWQSKVTVGFFIFFSLWWVYIQFSSNSTDTLQHQIFAALYGIIAVWGGVWGILISRKWGFYKSIIGRCILVFSLGLLAQEFGQIMYSYYIYFLKIDVPYPSLGDVGYFGSVLFYIYGSYLLGKASGIKIGLKSFENKIQAIIVPLVILGVGYFLFLSEYSFQEISPLQIFLDFGYPLGQAVYISFALLTYLLSRNILGGIMRNKILFILVALSIQFLSDYTFLYQASRGTWYAGGFNDFMYLTAYFIMTLGLLQLGAVLNKLKS